MKKNGWASFAAGLGIATFSGITYNQLVQAPKNRSLQAENSSLRQDVLDLRQDVLDLKQENIELRIEAICKGLELVIHAIASGTTPNDTAVWSIAPPRAGLSNPVYFYYFSQNDACKIMPELFNNLLAEENISADLRTRMTAILSNPLRPRSDELVLIDRNPVTGESSQITVEQALERVGEVGVMTGLSGLRTRAPEHAERINAIASEMGINFGPSRELSEYISRGSQGR